MRCGRARTQRFFGWRADNPTVPTGSAVREYGSDQRTQDIFQFFRGLGYSGVLLLGKTYLHYSNPERVPHYKFGMGGHRDFLFFPPEAIGTTIPFNLSRQFPQTALDF